MLFTESNFRELDDVFLQTQTRIWLGEMLLIRLDEETSVADLLADGKLLYQVSRVVWKKLLTKSVELQYSKACFSETPTFVKCKGRYMPYSNVDSFLKVCKILGLTSIDQFSPSDVVEKRDTRRVCMCIRSLSKKARSKDLNVPDFDVVTYTIAMPTNMVGCIRKSFEYPKKNWGAEYVRQDDSYSEGSDDTESNYHVSGFYSPASTTSCNSAPQLIPDIELGRNSLDVGSFILTQKMHHSDSQNEENDSQYRPSAEANGSVNVRCPSKSHYQFTNTCVDDMLSPSGLDYQRELNPGTPNTNNRAVRRVLSNFEKETNGLFPEDIDLRTSACLERDIYGCKSGNSDSNGCGTDSGVSCLGTNDSISLCEPALFDGEGENILFNFREAASFNGSNSAYKISRYQLGKRYPDDIEDIDTSSTVSLDSVSGKGDAIDYDYKLEPGDDFCSPNIQVSQHQNRGTSDIVNGCTRDRESQEVEYDVAADGWASSTDKLKVDTNLDDFLIPPLSLSPDYVCHSRITVSRASQVLDDANRVIDEAGLCDEALKEADMDVLENTNTSFFSDLNMPEEKSAQPSDGNFRMTELGDMARNCIAQPESEMESSVNLSSGLVESRPNDGSTGLYSMAKTDSPVVHYGDNILISPCISIPGTDSCEPVLSETTGKDNGIFQNLVDKDDLQITHQANCMEISDKDEEKGGQDVGNPERWTHKAVLLKSLAGGISLAGVVCLLLKFRKTNFGETSGQSSHIGIFREKKQQKGSVDGVYVYPSEKLRF